MTTRPDVAEQARTEEPAATGEASTGPTDPAATRPEPDAAPRPETTPQTASDAASTSDTAPEPDTAPESGATPASDATAEPGAAPASGVAPAKGGGRFTRARVMGAMAAMVVAAIAATAVLQWISATQAQDALTRLESERALRLEVSGAAGAFSTALLSYDYQDLQTTRSTLAAQATGDFLATYDAAFGGTMAQVIVKLKATAHATVREVYVADVDEATAHAIVVVDQQVNTSQAIRSVKDSHLKISLVKEKGTWKIHDVTVLGAASEDQYNLDGDEKKKD
ncbi:hypothetical protein [Nonomuraea sp. NPDC050643]|uniref:hypothetical protein n=1 Tax=Nonomuraea sp. NPDC050643 TaxID=3155660 RepID=UPI00340B73DA